MINYIIAAPRFRDVIGKLTVILIVSNFSRVRRSAHYKGGKYLLFNVVFFFGNAVVHHESNDEGQHVLP